MRDFMANIDEDELENARDTRNSTVNRPDLDFGMEEDTDDGWGAGFGDEDDAWSSLSTPSSGAYSDFGSPYSGGFGYNSGGFSPQYGDVKNKQVENNAPNTASTEDAILEAIGKFLKGMVSLISDCIKAFKTFNTIKKMHWGRNVLISSLGLVVLGCILGIFGITGVSSLIIAGFLSASVGTIVFMFEMDKLSKQVGEVAEEEEIEQEDIDQEDIDQEEVENTEDSWGDEEYEVDTPNNEEDNWFVDEDEESSTDLWDDFDKDVEDEDVQKEVEINPLDVLDRLNTDTYGLSRQYLYEAVTSCMVNKNKDFAKVVEYDEDSKEFLGFCAMVEKAASIIRPKTTQDPLQVIAIKDKLFYTLIELERPTWLTETNLNKFINELVSICSFDSKTYTKDETVFGMGDLVGNKAYVKIMKGENALITIKDSYQEVKDIMLDTKNKMPVVLGIDAEGEVIWKDFINVFSMLVTGEPRTGKSWTILGILSQLMAFNSPKELQFIAMDPKNRLSDLFPLTVPHIRKFVNTDEDIVQTLRWLVRDEAARREKIMFETGRYKDIKDLKKDHPEIDLPYLYVILDEVITLAERMSKEVKEEYQGYLLELVTRLPSYGIRIMMVPHVVKDAVISKTTTDMIPMRLSVCGDAQTIEHVTGAKPKEFRYKLSHNGDLAARINKDKVMFIHSTIVSDTNKGTDDFFNFLTNMWLKLEPETFKGSKLEKDIRNGLRSKSEFPSLENMDLDYIEEEKELVNSTRPKRKATIVYNDGDDKNVRKVRR